VTDLRAPDPDRERVHPGGVVTTRGDGQPVTDRLRCGMRMPRQRERALSIAAASLMLAGFGSIVAEAPLLRLVLTLLVVVSAFITAYWFRQPPGGACPPEHHGSA